MKIEKFNYPYEYIVIDDYLPQDDYAEIVHEVLTNHNKFSSDHLGRERTHVFTNEKNDTSGQWQFIADEANIFDEKYLLDNFEVHRPYRSLKKAYDINWSKPGHQHKIHAEAKNKVLTAVTYLYPEKATGTLLYDKNKKLVTEIEWKPNRCFVMCGVSDTTWHSFVAPIDSPRVTLVTMLLRDEDDVAM